MEMSISEQRLREFIENDKTYQDYKMHEPIFDYKRLHIALCEDIENVLNVLDEIREYIKYNATSNYFDADTNMFRREVDILQILDKANPSE